VWEFQFSGPRVVVLFLIDTGILAAKARDIRSNLIPEAGTQCCMTGFDSRKLASGRRIMSGPMFRDAG
jgi:hypothetical protein